MVIARKRDERTEHDQAKHDTFEEDVTAIHQIAFQQATRGGLGREDAEDFASWAVTRAMARDHAALRAFRGRSSKCTYQRTIVSRWLLDFRDHLWGRWRPSTRARRRGVVAVELERRVCRDGMTPAEAVAAVRACGPVGESRERLLRWASERPPGMRPRSRSLVDLQLPSGERADIALHVEARRRLLRRACRALSRVLLALTEEERELIAARYGAGKRVAEIARETSRRARPLYRRYQAILLRLRKGLLADGVSWSAVAELESSPEAGIELFEALGWGSAGSCPSMSGDEQ